MASSYIDAALNYQESLGDGSGDSWANARSWDLLSQFYNSLSPGQEVYIGTDIKEPVVIDISNEEILLTRTSAQYLSPYSLMFGAKGNIIYSNVEQETIKLIGNRPVPPQRNAGFFNIAFKVYADYHQVQGAQVYNTEWVFLMSVNNTGTTLTDIYTENVKYVVRGDDNCSDLTMTNIVGKDCSVSLLQLGFNASNIVVDDFSVHGCASEDGEARYININENHSNVRISNGTITCAVDMYEQDAPLPGGYNQGDGISIEEGGEVIINNVTVSGATDRGADIKAPLKMTGCEFYDCKIGVAAWNGGTFIDTHVHNPRSNSGNAGVGFQAVNEDVTLIECTASATVARGGHDDKPVVLIQMLNDLTATVQGGCYTHDVANPFLRAAANSTIILEEVEVNGVVYSGSKTFNTETYWTPADGF